MENVYVDSKICGSCGGQCCLTMPGSAFPDDFGVPEQWDGLGHALASGRWAVDWWDGDPRPGADELERGYYVRPAVVGDVSVFDSSWGGQCVFWRSSGCELEFGARPAQCRYLVPSPDWKCRHEDRWSKQAAAVAWVPYAEKLVELANTVSGGAGAPETDAYDNLAQALGWLGLSDGCDS